MARSIGLFRSNFISGRFSARDASRLCYDVSVRLSEVCALWLQGAMDPGYLCVLG